MKSIFEKLAIGLGVAIFFAISVAFGALLGGTILWLIWPYALPVVFPSAVVSGVLAAKIPWWTAVCVTWVFGILIKTSVNTKE